MTPASPARARRRWVREHYGRIELRGIERGRRKVLSLHLDRFRFGGDASPPL